jgi:RNA polymerase sigma-70 factor, ECF subfamily
MTSDETVDAAYTAHGAALRRHLLRLTRDDSVAEDLAQEAFIRLLSEVRSGRPPVDTARWLRRVATNLAISRSRRLQAADRWRQRHLTDGSAGPSPEDAVLDREQRRELAERLSSLPSDARTALMLAAHGFTGSEIGVEIGRTALATRSLLCRARTLIRAQLAAPAGQGEPASARS